MKKGKIGHLLLICSYLLILLIVSTSFAWFFINKELEVDYENEIICEAGTSLEISMLKNVDSETLNEEWTDYSGYVKYTGVSAKIEDISGNGKELYRPTAIETDPDTGELYPTGLTTAGKIDNNGYGDFIELNLKFRSTSNMNVYLSGDSIINPITTSDTDRNIFGKFSKDFIAGAIRVAILEVDDNGNEELKMIWAPNPNIQLIRKTDGTYDLKENGTIETYYYYKKNELSGEIEKYKVESDDFANKLFVLGSTNTTDSMVNKSPLLTTLTPSLDEVIEKRIVVRVWYEGTDREANQALSGGQVKMNLKFIGMLEKESQSEDVIETMNSIAFAYNDKTVTDIENISNKVYYSTNGYSWYACTESAVNTLINTINNRTEKLNVYFKYLETEVSYEYMVKHTFEYENRGDNNA